jgi:hypothetical protein
MSMKLKWIIQVVIFGNLLLCNVLCGAENLSCNQVAAISNMAASKSTPLLAKWQKKAGVSYIAHLVYSFRAFELNPTDQWVASRLLSLVPPSKEDESLWHTLDGFLCEQERIEEIKILAALQERIPHDIARAVVLVPKKMLDYVSYAYTSIQDPHSDYALQMRSVCLTQHKAFVGAVNKLPSDDRQWFVKKIFNTDECRAIAVPEAEGSLL